MEVVAANTPLSGAGERGARGRVTAVHHQTRRGLVVALAFALAAVVAALVPHDTGAWLPLHLFLVGGLLSAVAAVTQMLAVTWSASPPPSAMWAAGQRWMLGLGAAAIALGREAAQERLVEIGVVLVVAALLALVPMLLRIRARAVTDRYAPAIEGYIAALVAGVVGATIGGLLATVRITSSWDRWRAVHVTLNVWGLIGLVIAATLPFFAATQARRKMHPRATPRAIRTVLAWLTACVGMAALGQGIDGPALVTIGLVAYAVGLVGVAAMLPVYGRRQLSWAGPRLLQLGAGIAWWIGTTVAIGVLAVTGDGDGPPLRALVIGGYGQILAASLAYLAPVLRGGGHEALGAGFARTRSWIGLVAGNVAAVGAVAGANGVLTVALVVWALDALMRAVSLVVTDPARS